MPTTTRGPSPDPTDRIADLAGRPLAELRYPDVLKPELVRVIDRLRRAIRGLKGKLDTADRHIQELEQQIAELKQRRAPQSTPEALPEAALAVLRVLSRRPATAMSVAEITAQMRAARAGWGLRGSRNTVTKYVELLHDRQLITRLGERRKRWQISELGRQHIQAAGPA